MALAGLVSRSETTSLEINKTLSLRHRKLMFFRTCRNSAVSNFKNNTRTFSTVFAIYTEDYENINYRRTAS